jgi:hypothetical protein
MPCFAPVEGEGLCADTRRGQAITSSLLNKTVKDFRMAGV